MPDNLSNLRRRFLTRERLLGTAVALALGCVAFVYGLRRLELFITFHPDRMTAHQLCQYLNQVEQFMRDAMIRAR